MHRDLAHVLGVPFQSWSQENLPRWRVSGPFEGPAAVPSYVGDKVDRLPRSNGHAPEAEAAAGPRGGASPAKCAADVMTLCQSDFDAQKYAMAYTFAPGCRGSTS